MASTSTFEGGCTCREVRYRLASEPIFVQACHCRWCQRETGSAFVINALIEAERVELLQGQVDVVLTPSLSGKGQRISRCPSCRVALWSNYGGSGDTFRFVRVGTLDEPDQHPPRMHIFTMSKQPWLKLDGDIPAVHEYYDSSKVWPAQSLARRAAAIERAHGKPRPSAT